MDLAVNIAIGSSAQVALFVAPVLVLASFFIGPHPLALVFNGFELGAILLAVADRQLRHPGRRVDLVRGRPAARGLPRLRDRLLLRLSGLAVGSAGGRLPPLRQLRGHPRRRAALHQRGRVDRPPAAARRGRGRQPARRGRHGDAGDADLDRRPDRRRARAPTKSRSGRSSAPRSCSRPWRWGWSGSSPTSTGASASRGLSCSVHRPTLERDLLFFLAFFAVALASPGGAPAAASRIPLAVVFLLAYRSTSAARCGAAARCRSRADSTR